MKHAFILLAASLLALAGCGSPTKSTEYRSTTVKAAGPQALEVPPDLTSPAIDDRFVIPDPKAQTAFSTYSRDRTGAAPVSASAAGVLPPVDGARIERVGDQRWLVLKAPPDKVWPVVREFWTEIGFTIRRESPETGILETDWAENRDKIPQDIIRGTLGRVLDGAYSTNTRDKFRVRLERGIEPNTTEVYVTHRGVEEMYAGTSQERTVWTPRPPDRDLEAAMLERIRYKFGYDDKKVAATAGLSAVKPAPGSPAAKAEPVRNAVLQNNGSGPLTVNDGFDRAWRRVGLALDRVGFTVEDRDRSKGLFFVRYIDPEADIKDTSQQGFLDKLAFWKATPKGPQPQFRIHVADSGANLSQVEVQNSAGAPEASNTGKRILGLLFEQLK